MNSDKEEIIEELDIHDGMKIYNNFLITQEQEKLQKRAIQAVKSKENKKEKKPEERE